MISLTITGNTFPEIRVQFACLSSATTEEVEREIIAWLRDRDWCVTKLRNWETPRQICARLGISAQTLIRKTRDPRAIGLFEASWGGGLKRAKRLREIASTPAFDAFCLDHSPRK